MNAEWDERDVYLEEYGAISKIVQWSPNNGNNFVMQLPNRPTIFRLLLKPSDTIIRCKRALNCRIIHHISEIIRAAFDNAYLANYALLTMLMNHTKPLLTMVALVWSSGVN